MSIEARIKLKIPKKSNCIICKGKLYSIAKNLNTASSRADKILKFSIWKCINCGHLQKKIGTKYQNHLEDVYKTSYTLPGGGKKQILSMESQLAERVI
jgi:ribosomal protein L37AE/L43A